MSLHPVGVDAWGGFVFVQPHARCGRGPGDGRCQAQLAGVPERLRRYPLAELRVARRIDYEVAANWKVMLENYNECYHCGPVHPELCRLVPAFKQRGGSELDWERGIPHREGAWTFTESGTTTRAPFEGLDEDERIRHKGELIYPNLLLSLCAEHVAAFTVWPHGPARTTIVCEFLFHPAEMAKPGFDPADAVEFWDLVNRQDWTICESVQRGCARGSSRPATTRRWRAASLDIRRYIGERLGDDDTATKALAVTPGLRVHRARPGRLRQRRGLLARRAGPAPRCWGSSSSSWATCAASRRTTRGSSGSPTTRPATSSWPSTPSRAWEEVERDAGEQLVLRTGGLDFAPRRAPSRSATTATAWTRPA